MVLVVVRALLEGGLEDINDRSLGWITSENVSHDKVRMRNHGFGLSWGMSLRRGGGPLSLA